MRFFLAFAIVLAGCGGETETSEDAGMCLADCMTCGPGETCVPGDADHPGTCMKPCAGTADCTGGLRCTQLLPRSDRVCASAELPTRCSTGAFTYSDPGIAAVCTDARTLSKPFAEPKNATYGTYLQDCPLGCVDATTDADGGMVGAHCR
jgi:hypothetical protein